jgi:hypothetical protein
MLFCLGPEHERVSAARKQIVDQCVGAFWRIIASAQPFDRVRLDGYRAFTFAFAFTFSQHPNRAVGFAFPISAMSTTGRFVRHTIPSPTKDKTQDYRADTQQVGVVPEQPASEERYRDRHDRPSRTGLSEI